MSLLIDLQKRRPADTAGNKALNLYRLYKFGLKIPRTFVCVADAYLRYKTNDVSLVEELHVELAANLRTDRFYAVRSSANIEDGLARSYAGQFKSVLNVQGIDAILQAIWSVWASAQFPAVLTYLERHQIPVQELRMAVIIQEMVPASTAGVALSRNPVTGADEVVVEAVRGLGDALGQNGITPQRWVNKWGNWLARPPSDCSDEELISEVVDKTRRIASHFKMQVDIEWAYDGRDLYFLQMRGITTLNRHNVYSNHISKEMLPGIIKPLIGTINIPMVGTVWIRLLNELIGKTQVKPEELARTFYYRVYFNMGVLGKIFAEVGLPAESVELMMNVLPEGATRPAIRPTPKTFLRLPVMLKFAIEKWNFARPMRRALPDLEKQLKSFEYRSADRLSPEQLVAEAERLYAVLQETVYYNKVAQILMGMFNLGLKKQLAKAGVDFNNFDLMEGIDEVGLYDPNRYLYELHEQFIGLDPEMQDKICKVTFTEFMALGGLADFQSAVLAFLDRFGHLSDNGNDFSCRPWRESPDMVKQLIVSFVPEKREARRKIRFAEVRKTLWLRAVRKRARDFCALREQISSLYTFGYGLFRYYYLAMGAILASRGWIEDASDIYYLTDVQVKQAVLSREPLADYRGLIRQHKIDIERYRNVPLPSTIYGDEPPPIHDSSSAKLIGMPTSIGCYTGKVAAVRSIQDFSKVKQGDVLVIPYSDVSWTPLFARAGAIISESGGLLSHSSIVAREYNIPAVVSAVGAMGLQDQTVVTVNGHTGEVIIQCLPDAKSSV